MGERASASANGSLCVGTKLGTSGARTSGYGTRVTMPSSPVVTAMPRRDAASRPGDDAMVGAALGVARWALGVGSPRRVCVTRQLAVRVGSLETWRYPRSQGATSE